MIRCVSLVLLSLGVGEAVLGADKDCKNCDSPLVRVSKGQNAFYAGGIARKAKAFSPEATMAEVVSRFRMLGGKRIKTLTPQAAKSLASPALASRIYSQELSGKGAKAQLQVGASIHVAAHGKQFVNQRLEFNGIPLSKHCNALTILGRDRNPVAVRQRNVPSRVDSSRPDVSSKQAVKFAEDWLAKHHDEIGLPEEELDSIQSGEPHLEIYADGDSGKLCWTILVTSTRPLLPFSWQFWVSAVDKPKLLAHENHLYHFADGLVEGTLWLGRAEEQEGKRPLSGIRVTDGATQSVTDKDGNYSLPGASRNSIRLSLSGPHCDVRDQAGSPVNPKKSGNGGTVNIDFTRLDETGLAQVTAFFWTNQTREFVDDSLGDGLSLLRELPTNVNINDRCNAFWDGQSINFYRTGRFGECLNTAFADVVIHEYGHGIDDAIGGIVDGGYSEGFGDALAILITRQPCMGRGFLTSQECLRDARDDFADGMPVTWPPQDPEVHFVGRIYARFVWEFTQRLLETYEDSINDDAELKSFVFDRVARELILAAAAGNPSDIPEAIFLSFMADDGDGDLDTASPHFKELSAAAEAVNLKPSWTPTGTPEKPGTPTPPPSTPPTSSSGAAGFAQFGPGDVEDLTDAHAIAKVEVTLKSEADVFISADSSVRGQQGAARLTTGFYLDDESSLMWTDSMRAVDVSGGRWGHFGSSVVVRLPKGTHSLFWKVQVHRGTARLDGGSMRVTVKSPSSKKRSAAKSATPRKKR